MTYSGKWSPTVRRAVNRAQRAHKDADGYDLEQDSRWDEVDSSFFGADPSLGEWRRPYRPLMQRSPIRREDFDPAGLRSLGDVPATAVRGGALLDAPVTPPAGASNSF